MIRTHPKLSCQSRTLDNTLVDHSQEILDWTKEVHVGSHSQVPEKHSRPRHSTHASSIVIMDTAVATKPKAPEKKLDNGATVVERSTSLLSKGDRDKLKRRKEAERYSRGKKVDLKTVRDKKLRGSLKRLEDKYETAALKARDAEILHENTPGFLETEHELERTYKVRQSDITPDVAVATAEKRFDLKLEQLGPYVAEYTRNGRDLLLAGRKGHVATMDWREGKLGCELQLGETIRDARWLHNNQFFALAQKNYVYIYDKDGVELHCLTKHREVTHMEFLPYHFLLCTVVSCFQAYQGGVRVNIRRQRTDG